jgi:hypothetical protein
MKPGNAARLLTGAAIVLAAVTGPVRASRPAGAGESLPAGDWQVGIVDSTRTVGYDVSVAVDPATAETFVSYYEGIDGDLWLARSHPPPGDANCGPGGTWECRLVDSAGVVGKYNSIAVGGPGPIGWLHISYYDVTNGSLKAVHGTIDRATGALSLASDIIDRGDPASDIFIGTETAIAAGGTGTPHIAYQIRVGVVDAVKYATRVAPGTGNCGEGGAANDWRCGHVHLEQGVGDFIAIDVDAGGNPNIAFHSSFSTNTFPILATRVVSGGTCNNSDLWNCTEVRNGGQNTGDYLAFALGDNSLPHLAYRNENTDSLEWARWVGSPNGNCGPYYDSWQCERIDGIGPGGSPAGIAMAVDGQSDPIIVYQDVESGYEDLKIARPLGAVPWAPAGNCGPLSPSFFLTWYCETLDLGDLTHAEAYGGLSIAVNADGEASVAYRELFDPIISPERGRLKVALESGYLFGSGFESGDTAAWSSTVP